MLSLINNFLRKLTFFFGSIFMAIVAGTAQPKIDSLEQLLSTKRSSPNRTALQIDLLNQYLEFQPNKVPGLLEELNKQLGHETDPTALLNFYLAKSTYYRSIGEFSEARIAVEQTFPYVNNHRDSLLFQAKIYSALGTIFDMQNNIERSIEHHLKALRYAERYGDPDLLASVYYGLARAYMFIAENSTAKAYYTTAINLKEKSGHIDVDLARYYNNISSCYDAEARYDSSLYFLDKSIELNKEFDHHIQLITNYNNKAYTLFLMDKLQDAEQTVLRAISLVDSLDAEIEGMFPYSTYAEILFAQNQLDKAEEMMQVSIDLSKKYNDLYLARYNLDLLYNIHLKNGDYKKALEYFQQKSIVVDSIYNVNSRKSVEKLALEYETEKKNRAIELLNKENQIKEIELRKSVQLQIALLISTLLSLTVLGLLWSRHKNKVKTDKLLKEAMERGFEKKLADSELQALRAQMNPHFLFNCLNSINSFIIKNEQEQASEYLAKFSKLIRQVLNNSKSSKVTLANELESLRLYVEMEALRFNNKFEYRINVDPSLDQDYLEIPPLILQPYVENSIWHGLMHKKDGSGKLQIDIRPEEEALVCVIEDNGIGRKAAKAYKSKTAVKNKSYGMSITKDRLSYINRKYKESTHVEVVDLEDCEGNSMGTKVIIKIIVD